ncbi:hypothetical protein [Actinoplanes sp. NPDC051494]|uniref:hypothetical protein n=1 Tax=Actinoplanes sp. NPDC051494 TaxID=3363907 RepID=UPI0037A010A1
MNPEPIGPEPVTVRCRDVGGRIRTLRLTDHGAFSSPGSALPQRLVMPPSGVPLVRKSVPPGAAPELYTLLDNEVRAGTRLGQVYAGGYPQELACVVGYDMDAAEPFVLLRAYAGEPAPDVAGRLDESRRRMLQTGLLRALELTAAAGVVHGAVTLDRLRWAGSYAQLVDFESARPGDGREDLWAAGALLRALVLGAPDGGPAAGHATDPPQLRALLDGVFGPVAQRPRPGELRRRMRDDTPVPAAGDPEAPFAAGRLRFDEICAGRRPPGQRTEPPASEPPAPGRRSRWRGIF